MKKLVTIFVVLILCSTCLFGCKNVVFTMGLGDDEMMKIGSDVMSKGEGTFAFLKEKLDYEQSFGEGIWGQDINDMSMLDYLKSTVKAKLIEMRTMCLMGREEGVKFDASTENEAKKLADEWINKLGKDKMEEYNIKDQDVLDYFNDYCYEQAVYNSIVSDLKIDLSDSRTKVIDILYIYFGNEEGSEDQAKKAMERINKGEDFKTVAEELSKDEKVEMTLGKDQAYPEFEEAAFALKSGEVSDIVKTENGYYIIKCIDDYMIVETKMNREKIEAEMKRQAVEEKYVPFVKDLAVEFNDDYLNELQ